MKNMFAFSLIAALLLTVSWANASEGVSQELKESIVRLHIIANSNSEEDQLLKLSVRDRLLQEAKNSKHLLTDQEILAVCKREVEKNGYSYPITISRGFFDFPQKSYDNLTLPAGKYNAVRIVIGEGKGENWWCVMYPPLCFTAETQGQLGEKELALLQGSLSPETYKLICESDRIVIKPSFKLVELWQRFTDFWTH